jgi:hypothetical protein
VVLLEVGCPILNAAGGVATPPTTAGPENNSRGQHRLPISGAQTLGGCAVGNLDQGARFPELAAVLPSGRSRVRGWSWRSSRRQALPLGGDPTGTPRIGVYGGVFKGGKMQGYVTPLYVTPGSNVGLSVTEDTSAAQLL